MEGICLEIPRFLFLLFVEHHFYVVSQCRFWFFGCPCRYRYVSVVRCDAELIAAERCIPFTHQTVYGAWGALVTVYGLIAGVVVDRIGVSQSLRLGFAISWFARLGLLLTTTRAVLYFLVLFLLPLGNCLGIPVLATGIRRYTTEQARGFAFGLFYVIMNVAALVSGPVVDMLTIGSTGSAATHGDAPAAWSLTPYRAVVLTGLLANTIACGVAWTVQEVKVTSSLASADVSRIAQPTKLPPSTILRQVLTAPSFRRFVVVCLLTVNVRMIFRHLDATLPKYMLREFGASVPKGTIYSINPALIIILVPLVTAATTHMDPLAVIHGGTYISAASVMFLVMSTSIGACVGFVVVLSIGEAIWSPRLVRTNPCVEVVTEPNRDPSRL